MTGRVTLVSGWPQGYVAAAHSALPTLFAAAADEAEPGAYYGPNVLFELKANPRKVSLAKAATNVGNGIRLWQVAERLTDGT
jgi:hypothetical protein